MRAATRYFAVLLLATASGPVNCIAAQAEGASTPAQADPPQRPKTAESCQMGGFQPGMEVKDVLKDRKKFRRTSSMIVEPRFGISFEVLPSSPYRRDLLSVVGNRIWSVSREYYGDDAKAIYAVLKERYGEPLTYDVTQAHKQGFLDPQENSQGEDHALWRDKECNQEIELVRLAKLVARPWKGGGVQMLAASAVIIRPAEEHKSNPSLLK